MKPFIRLLARLYRRRRLIHLGRSIMRHNLAACEELACGDLNYAERVCPSLKRLRRAARACALRARRLS